MNQSVRVLQYLEGVGGISFVEYLTLKDNKVRILSYRNFVKRYGEPEQINTKEK